MMSMVSMAEWLRLLTVDQDFAGSIPARHPIGQSYNGSMLVPKTNCEGSIPS